MAVSDLISAESTLVGTIVNAAVTTTTLSIDVEFKDSKTGVAREPQSTTLDFVIDKDNSNWEQIKCDSHSTASGVTTLVVNASGRAIPKFGTGAGSATGNAHPIGAQIGCVYTHNQVEVLNKIMDGTDSTPGQNFRVGDGTAVDQTIFFIDDQVNPSFIQKDSATGKVLISNDGTSTYDPQAGGSGVTAGDGIDITAGVIDLDLKANAGLEIDTTELAVELLTDGGIDAGAGGLRLDLSDGTYTAGPLATVISDVTTTAAEINQLDGISANVTDTNLNTLTAGPTSDADALHTHAAEVTALQTAEAVDGSSTPKAMALLGDEFRWEVFISTATNDFWTHTSGTNLDLGDDGARNRLAQSFTVTDAEADTITLDQIQVMLRKFNSPSDNVQILIQGDDGGEPDGVTITNGSSATIAGGSINSAYKVETFTWSTPPTLTSGTMYWAVIDRSVADDASNYYTILGANADSYSSHNRATLNSGTGTWSTNSQDICLAIRGSIDYGSGLVAYSNHENLTTPRCNFIGFTESNVAADANADIDTSKIIDGFTGLTPGEPYYIGADGAIVVSASVSGTVAARLGTAISSTQLLVDPGSRIYEYYSSDTLSFADTGDTLSIFFETGFMPDQVYVKAIYTDNSVTKKDIVIANFVLKDEVSWVHIKDLNNNRQHGTNTSSVGFGDNGSITGVGFEQNGFTVTFSQEANNDTFDEIQVLAIQY